MREGQLEGDGGEGRETEARPSIPSKDSTESSWLSQAVPFRRWAAINHSPYWKCTIKGLELGALIAASILAFGAFAIQSDANDLARAQFAASMAENRQQFAEIQSVTQRQLDIARQQNGLIQAQITDAQAQFSESQKDAESQLALLRQQLFKAEIEFQINQKLTVEQIALAREQNHSTQEQFYRAYRASLYSTIYDRKENCHERERGDDGRCPVLADIRSREEALKALVSIESESDSVSLADVDLRTAHLQGVDLSNAQLPRAFLAGVDLRGAVLRGADMADAIFLQANLSTADLRDASLCGADLSGASLQSADLRGVDFTGAKNLTRKQIEGALLDERTRLPKYILDPASRHTVYRSSQ